MDDRRLLSQNQFIAQKLTRTERLVLMLWKIEGLTDLEIATTLDLPPGLIISVKAALRNRLGIYLADFEAANIISTS
ncbi:MAG: hypothetical protein JJU36_17075 [Phycisphaeraceae bacterium]|nr:hypothetical protein [Phycisphaeraceae bacterium]